VLIEQRSISSAELIFVLPSFPLLSLFPSLADERDHITRHFANCSALQSLTLNNTSVTGDCATVFKGKPDLRVLRVVNCPRLTGDLAIFKKEANNGAVAGVSSSSSSSSLTGGDVGLAESDGVGSSSGLLFGSPLFRPPSGANDSCSMVHLTELDLRKCEGIAGKLEDVAVAFECLTVLCLDETKVEGDLGCLKKRTGLRCVRLSGMGEQIRGKLSTFSQHLSLEELHLNETRVTGKISDVQNLEKLHTLVLDGLRSLTGNVSALKR
jgi:hypothetical protein